MNLNPKKMETLMKQLGIKFEDIKDVEEIIIKTKDGEYVIHSGDVKIINAGNVKTLQAIINDMKYNEKIEVSEEDIKIIMEKANVSYEEAKKYLIKNKGDLAKTLIDIEQNK